MFMRKNSFLFWHVHWKPTFPHSSHLPCACLFALLPVCKQYLDMPLFDLFSTWNTGYSRTRLSRVKIDKKVINLFYLRTSSLSLNKVYSQGILEHLKQNTVSCTTSQTAYMSTTLLHLKLPLDNSFFLAAIWQRVLRFPLGPTGEILGESLIDPDWHWCTLTKLVS